MELWSELMSSNNYYAVEIQYHTTGQQIGVPHVLITPEDVAPTDVLDVYFEEQYAADVPAPLSYGVPDDGVEICSIEAIDEDTYETLAEYNPIISLEMTERGRRALSTT